MTHNEYKAITDAFQVKRAMGLTHKEYEVVNDLACRIAFNLYLDNPKIGGKWFMIDTGMDEDIAENIYYGYAKNLINDERDGGNQ